MKNFLQVNRAPVAKKTILLNKLSNGRKKGLSMSQVGTKSSELPGLLLNQSFGTVGSPNQTGVKKPIDFWLRKGRLAGSHSRPRMSRTMIKHYMCANQTGETLTRENRIGLMSYLRRTLMLLFAVLTLSIANIGNVWGANGDVLFTQAFGSGSLTYTQNVAYTKTTTLTNLVGNGSNLFTSLTTSNKNSTGIAINHATGGGSTNATGFFQAYFNNTSGYWSCIRTNDFAATAPTALKMTIDVWVNIISGTSNAAGVYFAIGNGFTDALKSSSAADATKVHSGFGITAETNPTICQYNTPGTDIYATTLSKSTWLSITWIMNNTGSSLTYNNPTGSGTTTLANDKFDIWLKTQAGAASTYTKVVSAQSATTASIDLQELYIGSTGGKKMEFRMDNIVVTDLTPGAACTAPNHVDISGTWGRFGGEDISLTAAAYSSAGTGSPIADANITGWQWQKLIGSTWTNVSNGTSAGVTTSGATTKNLQISNCGQGNSGKYRCVVSTGATCSTASATATDGSEGYGVKVYTLECYTGGTTTYNFTRDGNNDRGSVEVDLAARAEGHVFKIHADDYYGATGNIYADEDDWVFTTAGDNVNVHPGLGGTFTFTIDYSSNGAEPVLEVTYPRKTVYLVPNSDWISNSAKFAFYYWGTGDGNNGWTSFLSASVCDAAVYPASIPQWDGLQIIGVRFNSSEASPGWNGDGHVWNQTQDLTASSYDKVAINGWNSATYNSNYAAPTYTISFAANGGSGTMTSLSSIACDADKAVTANSYTKTGYSFAGWKANVDVKINGSTVSAGTVIADKVTIQNIRSNITLTAQWNVNSYNLTWDLAGGTTTSAGTGIANGVSVNTTSSVAYGTSLTAPTVTKANYDFSAWSPAVASTMPAAATTYTATWTAKKYNVTTSLTDMTVSSGTTGDNAATYGTNYSLTLAADDGYVLPASITVTIGGDAAPGGSYSYNSSTGVVTITGSYITGAIVITAAGAENVFYVTYAANGGSGSVPTDANAYDPDEEVTVLGKNTLSKSGYTFCGWSYNGYVYVEGDKFNITESATLTAVWNQNATTVTLTHFGKQFKTSDPRRGYAYVGSTSGTKYIIESNSSDVKNSDGDSSAIVLPYSNKFLKVLGPGSTTSITDSLFSNVTQISFKWKYVGSTTTYTTGIDVYVGSTKVETKSLTGNKNDSYATATVSNIASLSGAVKFVNTGTSSSNQKFWLDDIAITYSASTYKKVSFNKGSGPSTVSGLPADRYVPSGSKIAEPATDPTAANYIFNGWVTESGGSTPFDFANTPITTDKTIYAKWTAKTSPGSGTVSGTTSICSGNNTNVTLSTSVSGASYQLYKDNVASGDPKPGTGSALNWSVSAAGTYTVKAVETATHASGNMSGSATISIYTALSKTSDPTASQTATVGQGCALSGLTYAGNANVACQWQSCTDATPSSASNISDGGAYSNCTTSAMTFTPASAGTYYFRCVVSDDCGTSFNSGVVTVTAKVAPTVYSVSSSPSTPVHLCDETATISLSGSQSGVNYQLYKNGVAEGDPKAGTGSAISWTGIDAAGTYTVKTVETSTYAEATMTGSVSISIMTPTSISTQPTASVTGHDGVNFTLGSNLVGAGEGDLTYQWYSYTNSSGDGEATVGSATTTKTLTTSKSAGTYYYKVEVIGECGSVKSNMITVTVDNKHLLTYNANNGSGAPGSSYIAPGSTTLSSTIPTRSSYVFLGWNTNSTGTGDMYQPGATYTMPATATTLWAAWGSACFNVSDASKKTMPDGQPAGTVITGGGMINGTITGGTLTYTGTDAAGLNGNAKGLIFNNDNDELTVNITEGMLQEGTVIVIGSYGTASSSSHTNGLKVSGNNMSPATVVSSTSNNSISQRYVVADGDGIEGTSSFTIRRVASTDQMMLNTISVAGCMSCTAITPSLSYDHTTLYAFGGSPREAHPTLTGNTGSGAVSYSSSNTGVATVDSETGVVTAVGAGTATITASIASAGDYCGGNASCAITVPALVTQTINVGNSGAAVAWGTPPNMTFNDPTSTLTQNAVIDVIGYTFNKETTYKGQRDGRYMTADIKAANGAMSDSKYLSLSFNSPNHNIRVGEVIFAIQPITNRLVAKASISDGTTTVTSAESDSINAGVITDVKFTFTPTTLKAGTITVKIYVYGQPANKGFRLANTIYVNGGVLVDQKFTNANSTGLWSDPANWDGGSLPEIYHDVVIEKPVNVDITDAVAKSVVIYNNGSTKTGSVEINPGKELVVAETIKKTTDGSAKIATTASDLYIGSDASHGNGALVAGSASANTVAGVAFYTKARKEEDKYVNQFIGVPLASMTAYDGFYGMYVYGYDAVNDAWKSVSNNGAMYPFTAYNLLRKEATASTLYMAGTLNLPGTSGTEVLSMGTRTGSKASDYDYLFANSWTAPIDVKSIEASDFSNAEATIYIFNAGTKSDYDTNGGNYTTSKTNNPGQWLYMPVSAVAANPGDFTLTVIPSMEAFMVKKSSASSASLTLDYKKHVYDPAVGGTATVVPNRAPRRQAADELTRIRLYVTGESGPADNLLMFEREDFSTGFDNGWEARKIMGSAFAPQMYAMSEEGKMAINCVPNLEGTVIGFKAGTDDENYTFSFDYDEEAEELYLLDIQTGVYTRVTKENSYAFFADDKEEHNRFILTRNAPGVLTGINEVQSDKDPAKGVFKFIENDKMYILYRGVLYDATGKKVSEINK